MEALELKDHPFFCAVQYHPEYLSRPLKPSPPYVGLILAASNQLETDLGRNLRSLAIRSRNSSINIPSTKPMVTLTETTDNAAPEIVTAAVDPQELKVVLENIAAAAATTNGQVSE